MPNNPLLPADILNYYQWSAQNGINPPQLPAGYVLATDPTTTGILALRLFDAAYITTGIIDPNRLGTGATGAGNLYLADDGTWKPVAGGGGGGDMYKATYDIDNSGIVDKAEALTTLGRNSTGATLYEGTIVRIEGSTGNRPNFVKAQANNDANSAQTFGVVMTDIANNSDGYVLVQGTLHDLDTRTGAGGATHPFTDVTLVDGDLLFLHPTIAGYVTNIKPSAPQHLVYVGVVTRTSPTNGTIVYRIQNGYELYELHDVAPLPYINNGVLYRDTATNLWKSATIDTILGGTPLLTIPTLAQVTTAGNTTTNNITVGGVTVGQVGGSGVISFPTTVSGHLASIYSVYAGNKIVIQVGSRTFNLDGGGQITTNFNTVITGSTGAAALVVQQGNAAWSPVADFNGSAGTALRVNTNGNILIGTTTDAGYKLDVNGTARIATSLTVSTAGSGSMNTYLGGSVAIGNDFVNNGYILQIKSVNTGIAGIYLRAGGAGGYPILFCQDANGTASTTFIVRETGNVAIGTTTAIAKFTVTGSITAASLLAQGVYFNNTLVAAANNDVLVGLDINPTFTNGAFTGVSNFAIRAYGYSNFQSGINIYPANPAWSGGRPIQGALFTYVVDSVNYYAGYSSGSGFFHKFWTNATERVRISDGYTSIVSGNLLVGTTTDAGYKLNVNGTTYSSNYVGNSLQIYGQAQIFSGNPLQIFNSANNSKSSIQYINGSGLNIYNNSENLAGVLRLATISGNTVAAANNDSLIGLHVDMAGNANSFTGVNGWGLITGSLSGYNLRFHRTQYGFAERLSLNGYNSGTPNAHIYIQDVSSGGTYIGGGGGEIQLGGGGGKIYTGGGNFLIGTSADAGYKLDVAGKIRTTGSGTNGVILHDGTYGAKVWSNGYIFTIEKEGTYGPTTYLFKYADGSSAINLNGTAIIGLGGSDDGVMMSRNVYARHNAAFGFTSYGGTTQYKAIQALFTDNNTSGVAFNYKTGGTDTEAMRINSAGYIGIGTTSPLFKVDISNRVMLGQYPASATYGAVYLGNINPSNTNYTLTSNSVDTYLNGTSSINFSINDVIKAKIASTGNFLIGTTTDAGYKLDVNGTAIVQTNLNVGDTAFTATTPNYISLGGTYANSGYGAKLKLLDSGSTQWGLGISTAGINYYGSFHNFFAGTTTAAIVISPSADTTSTSPAYISIGQSYSSVAGANPKLRLFGTTYGLGVSAGQVDYIAPSHVFYANGTEAMRITSAGNVGIGTTTPTDIFHIVNNTNGNKFGRISAGGSNASAAWVAQNDLVDNIVYRVFGSGVSGTQMGVNLARSASLIANLDGSGKFLIGTYSNTDVVFGAGDQERMRLINNTGNFLIGTLTDVGTKLNVSGDINAMGYRINNVIGYTGILNIPGNPPGMQNVDIQGGIIVNVF